MARVDRVGAEAWVPAQTDLPTLAEAVQRCRGCELYLDTTQAVLGVGPIDAGLMLVGEQPGDVEDRVGAPFVGPAGRILRRALEEAEIEASEVYTTNAVKHFGHHVVGRRRIHDTPKVGQVKACAPWLRAEIHEVSPRGVVLLGATAARAVHGSDFRLRAGRGQLLAWPPAYAVDPAPAWTLATIHPSAVLRSRQREADFRGLVADLRVAREAYHQGEG